MLFHVVSYLNVMFSNAVVESKDRRLGMPVGQPPVHVVSRFPIQFVARDDRQLVIHVVFYAFGLGGLVPAMFRIGERSTSFIAV
jgi:hypothetical protein